MVHGILPGRLKRQCLMAYPPAAERAGSKELRSVLWIVWGVALWVIVSVLLSLFLALVVIRTRRQRKKRDGEDQ
jgi:heme/copper-type cytochrome/quinol oxidase subunit 2